MKKGFLSLLTILLTVLIIVSCCKKTFDDLYFNVSDIVAKNTYNFRDIGEGVTIGQEGYLIKLTLTDTMKEAIENINSIRKSLDYCEDNEVALKNDIQNLTLSCNQTIWDTPAGTPLDLSRIRIFEHQADSNSEITRMTVKDWIDLINTKTQFIEFEWYMEFNEVITSTEYLKFQLQFELKNGSIYHTETGLVKLE